MNFKTILNAAWIIATISIITGGCSQQDELDFPQTDGMPDALHSMISDFHQRLHPSSRAADAIEITGIETRTYHQGDFSGVTPEVRSDLKEYDVTTVTLKIGDSPGYAILSDTPGIERIFYYTESGCIGDTALIPPLKEIVETAPIMADLILSGIIPSQRHEMINYVNIDPIVRFQWHQNWPYNFYAHPCSCSKCSSNERKGHMFAGCVPVAVAQAIATMKHFKGTFYGNRDIDFDSFPSSTTYDIESINPGMVLSLAHFLQEIALNCQTKYGCDGTSADLCAPTKYMRDMGYLVDDIEGALDVDRFIDFLKRGNPHIMGGSNGELGHAWILDGIRTWENYYYFHINWGWGPNISPGWSNQCFYGEFISSEYEFSFPNFPYFTEHMYILAPGS